MVIPMKPGPRGLSSRPPLYSQLYHSRGRSDLIDLTSMEEESAPDDRRGLIEISRESVSTDQGDSQRVSRAGVYPSEIHVTSPRKDPPYASPRRAELSSPLHIGHSDHRSFDHNAQNNEYGWSAHDYPSVVNVIGIDDVSEMGFQSQNGDHVNGKESKSPKTPISYNQSYHRSDVISVELDNPANEMLLRMKLLKDRMKIESHQGPDNDSISHRHCMSVASGCAIVNGEDIVHDCRDDLPLEVNIKARDDSVDDRIQRGHDTHGLMEGLGSVPGEVNVSLKTASSLRYEQASYGTSPSMRDDEEKEEIQGNEDCRDLHTSRSSQSMYLRALNRRLGVKWRRSGVASKGFEEPLTLSLSEPFSTSVPGHTIQISDVDTIDQDGPEIIDLNDYEENDSQFFLKGELVETDVADRGEENEEKHDDNLIAEKNDEQPVTTTERVGVSEDAEEDNRLQATEEDNLIQGTEEVRTEFVETCNENQPTHHCDNVDDQSVDVEHVDAEHDDVSESETQANTPNSRGRERSRVSRAERKRKITGRLPQDSREEKPSNTISDTNGPSLVINTQEDIDKCISNSLSDRVGSSKEEDVPDVTNPDEESDSADSPKSHAVTEASKSTQQELYFEALVEIAEKESRDQDPFSSNETGPGTMQVKSEEEERGEHYTTTVNGDDDTGTMVDRTNSQLAVNDRQNDVFEERKSQPLSLDLNASDFATTSGSSGCEVEVGDLYVSSSNSEGHIDEREAENNSVGITQGHSSEDAGDIASVAYTNTSESDLEQEYDIYDQCVMPFIPKFLDTACAWLDGEEYGPRPRRSGPSLLYKLKKKNVGQRKSNASQRSGSRSRKSFKDSTGVDLREVSQFARPRRSHGSIAERNQNRDPPDDSLKTAPSPLYADIVTQAKAAADRDGQLKFENGRNVTAVQSGQEPLRFTFSDNKSVVDTTERQNATSTKTEKVTRGCDPSGEQSPMSRSAERSEYEMFDIGDTDLPIHLQGGHASPFRKKLHERMESIKNRDTIADEDKVMDSRVNVIKASESRLPLHSPLRNSHHTSNLSPQASQRIPPIGKRESDLRSPKQAEIVTITPKTGQTARGKANKANKPFGKSPHHSASVSGSSPHPFPPTQDKQMATFREGRLVFTATTPGKKLAVLSQRETIAESSQTVKNESPFDESSHKLDSDAGQCFAAKLRERNCKRLSKAAGGPESLQGIRARRRAIEQQQQFASSSRNRFSHERSVGESSIEDQVPKSTKPLDDDSNSARSLSRRDEKRRSPTRRGSKTRSPSKRTDRRSMDAEVDGRESESEAHNDMIDAEMAASLSAMNEDERNAALELVEKLRRRASTLQRRQKVRSRRLKKAEELEQDFKRVSNSLSDSGPHVSKQDWGTHGVGIVAA